MAATKKKPSEGDTRIVRKPCHQCGKRTEVYNNGAWYCVNKCGPKGLSDLMRF